MKKIKDIIKSSRFLTEISSNLYLSNKRILLNGIGNLIIKRERDFDPCIVTMVDGGLGSQMWQFALGYCASLVSGLPVKYDISWFNNYGMDINGIYKRNFNILNVFPNIPFGIASDYDVRLYKTYFYKCNKKICSYNKDFILSKSPRYLGGYYQNYRYIDNGVENLREILRFPEYVLSDNNTYISSQIKSCACPIAVHIRRGDYVNSMHDVIKPNYFYQSINILKEKLANLTPVFFIFSNDLDYCRTILNKIEGRFIYVDGNNNDNGEHDMALMSQCRHFIISNSSFSWWPAWLAEDKDKIVICPDRWFNDDAPKSFKDGNKTAMNCPGWIALPTD